MYRDCLRELYEASEGEDIGLSFADFVQCLLDLGRNELGPDISRSQAIDFCSKLHLKDLALAQACSRGIAVAWERFVCRYRGRLYAAALVLVKDEPLARELSDSISGDLFGSGARDGDMRIPKLASYTGRGSLDAWLKAVLTHAYVDRYRSERRVVSLERHLDSLKSLVSEGVERSTGDPRLNDAIKEAFLQCRAEKRFLLAAYFFDKKTLAEIAGTLKVHESTVSRRLNRTLHELRKSIACSLRKRGMSMREIQELLQTDVRSLSLDVRGLLPNTNLVRE